MSLTSHICFLPVKVLSHALYVAFLLQRFYLPPSGRLHRTQFPIESNRSGRSRPSCVDWLQCLAGVDELTCHRWPYRALHFLLGPIRRLVLQTRARQDAVGSSLGRHAEVRRGSLVVVRSFVGPSVLRW